MYIVAIAWIYVTLLMAATERSLVAGVMTFLTYGLGPLLLFLWLFGGPRRRRAAAIGQISGRDAPQARTAERTSVPGDVAHEPDRADAKADQ